MRNTPQREISGPDGKLAKLEPFTGNSLSGGGDVDREGYSVRSYATEIARVIRHPETGRFLKLCTESGTYSTTTSRGQNMCRAWLPGELIDVDAPERGGSIEIPAGIVEPSAFAKRVGLEPGERITLAGKRVEPSARHTADVREARDAAAGRPTVGPVRVLTPWKQN